MSSYGHAIKIFIKKCFYVISCSGKYIDLLISTLRKEWHVEYQMFNNFSDVPFLT